MTIRTRAEDYLAMRRALGYRLHAEGRMLLEFAERLDAAGQPTITVSTALAWAMEPRTATPTYWCRRLGVVRGFARHLHTLDPSCEVPPTDLLSGPAQRPTPYIYTSEEVAALVHAAQTLAAPMPAATCHAVISLIAASGLRLGETLALDRVDVDLDAAILTVTGKNQHTRLIPLHPTTVQMLDRYATRRDLLCAATDSASFFLTTRGHRPQPSSLQHTFAKLLVLAEIPTPPGRRRPRIHDLRHTFAVNTLIGWYRSGADVAARMPILSTFLGHSAGPETTYWYLQATPELLALAAQRLDHDRSTS